MSTREPLKPVENLRLKQDLEMTSAFPNLAARLWGSEAWRQPAASDENGAPSTSGSGQDSIMFPNFRALLQRHLGQAGAVGGLERQETTEEHRLLKRGK